MAELLVPNVDFAPLGKLGDVYREGQNRRTLSDLGQGLADGSVDYRQAAARTAGMGDITHTLQFLALDEAAKKKVLERQAVADFGNSGLPGISPNPAPQSTMPNPMPVPGARATIPAPAAGGLVPSSARVVGDEEGVKSGLYEKPVTPGQRPPLQTLQTAQAAPVAAAEEADDNNIPSAKHIPALLKARVNPDLPQAQRELADTMLKEAYKNSKEPERITLLKAYKNNPALLELEKSLKSPLVNIDQKSETELSKGLAKGLSERINKIADEGDSARTDLAMVGQLRDLGAVIDTGLGPAIQGKLAEYGIKVGPNVDKIEAYGAIVDKMVPAQRIPGSGSTSDFDAKGFKSSLPALMKTPGGNAIIETTLAGLAQYKLDRAAIADRVQAGELSAKDGLKQMRDLPNPYENFKNFSKSGFKADPNNPASVAPPQDTGAAKQVPFTKVEIDQSLANARAKIKQDPASRDFVIQRLKENGLPTSGL